MKIAFIPLDISHFPLLLKWLETPHVKAWWDQDIIHTEESIKEKYSSYVTEHGKISAFIICLEDKPIGYIQIYNAHDFLSITDLPRSIGAIDFYIGEEEYLRQGIGAKILKNFDYKEFDYVLVDPDIDNISAIITYEKAGFNKFKEHLETNEVWMIKKIPAERTSNMRII